jgi:tetratricopeptide (TPR) repeat protein
MLWMVHRDDQAITQLRKAVELEPSFAGPHRDLAYIYYFKKMNAEGMAEYLQALKYSGSSEDELAKFKEAYRVSGWRGIWQKQIELDQERMTEGKITYATTFAMNYALLGDKEQTLEWLERAYQNREGQGLRWINSDPRLDSLRPEPRFQDLVRRVGLSR